MLNIGAGAGAGAGAGVGAEKEHAGGGHSAIVRPGGGLAEAAAVLAQRLGLKSGRYKRYR